MVGIVIVSHSEALADGVVALAREMGGAELAIEAAGGIDEPGVLGTDAERVRAAVQRVMSDDGVLVLMDLGSALMSAELAIELLGEGSGRVLLSAAPLVEGAVAAAAVAAGGATLAQVAAEAQGALAMKASQLGPDEAETAEAAGSTEPTGPTVADVRAELPVRNAVGLHARPAARLLELARGFDADITVARGPDGDAVRASSLTRVIGLGARKGDTLVVTASGRQAHEAVEALVALAQEGFGDGVGETIPASRTRTGAPSPSPVRRPASGETLQGVGGSPGIALGPARHLIQTGMDEPPDEPSGEAPERESERLEEAIDAARQAIARDRAAMVQRAGVPESEIFDAHLELLADEAILDPALRAIADGATAERAWYAAIGQVAALYRALEDPLLRERSSDVVDVGRRVLASLRNEPAAAIGAGAGAEKGIIIVSELTPADAALLDPELVSAIVTAHGSATSHAAILARALGLPAVVGLGEAVLAIDDGTQVLLDGGAGTLMLEPSPAAADQARRRTEALRTRQRSAMRRAREPGTTRDGSPVEIFANVANLAQARHAVAAGAEGVGLLRTEFLYLDRAELPGEDEQIGTLREIASALDGRPLIVRTLDAGADKPLPALPMPAEANPFLGVRGIRASLDQPAVLATQLRAILRVAADFPVKLMLPMVAIGGEISQARALLDQARAQTGIDAPLELGIMVEVPAAALTAERLAEQVDFFSLGTNDLTQYVMAAERGNERLAPLLTGLQPAVLMLVHQTVLAAAALGRWVGVCGELAGDPAAAILLVGLGVTELSMAPALIPEIKATLRAVDRSQAATAARAALMARDANQARACVQPLLSASRRIR